MPHLEPKPSFNAQSMIGAEPVFYAGLIKPCVTRFRQRLHEI